MGQDYAEAREEEERHYYEEKRKSYLRDRIHLATIIAMAGLLGWIVVEALITIIGGLMR